MNKVTVRAPVRVDLAGGTLDLWPLYLFHPGARTINVAISFYAEAEIVKSASGGIEIHLIDQQYRQHYESLTEMARDPKASLLHRLVEHFKLSGIRITTRTDAPRGSGLGGSSALAVAVVRGLSEIAEQPVDGEDLIALVRDLETRHLGIPAGIQDYYPAVYGGLGSLHLNAGRPARHPLHTSAHDLAPHLMLHYSGIGRFSGTNNWTLFKRHLEGQKTIYDGMAGIAESAIEMERALDAGNYEAAGAALRKEWEHRKALIDGISTVEIDAAIHAASNAGAWGGKVCGAGGGGCIVFLLPPYRRQEIARALAAVPGRALDAIPVPHGMTVEFDRDEHAPVTPRPRLPLRGEEGAIEQLYVYGGTGDYVPFVLAEGLVTHSEPRSGIHHTAARAFIAPLAPGDGRAVWSEASPIEPEMLDIRAVPDAARELRADITPEALVQGAVQSEEGFCQFLEENERLQILHNPAFALYSEPGETREAFLSRCDEQAKRQLEDVQEKLESTFRRRIDQLRERAEKEQRAMESDEEGTPADGQELNVAWGQTLYNITTGRPGADPDPATSAREGDYRENIAQLRRAWDRELEAQREEIEAKARTIEELTIIPSAKNIEVTRYVILWAADLP
jgi:D-glycero-alpha-D-manno-heptose-7-phosphate kinase